jgi:hypothetical protein
MKTEPERCDTKKMPLSEIREALAAGGDTLKAPGPPRPGPGVAKVRRPKRDEAARVGRP